MPTSPPAPDAARPRARALAALALVALACGREMDPPGAALRAPGATDPSAGCARPPSAAATGERRRLAVGGETREFVLDAPPSRAGDPLPVVLSFHGFRGSARRHRWWTGMAKLARHERFVAVHPEGHEGVALLGTTGRGWDMWPGQRRDVEFVRGLLDALEAERCVDRARVFATGMSNGGFFANLLGCALADRVAAIAPVAGAMAPRGCAPARAPRVLFVWGAADRVVRADLVYGARDWWARVQGCGAAVREAGCERYTGCAAELLFCEGSHAHRWPSGTSERVWRFFTAG
jgi:polyhydroxybutyrate depolymerase